MPGNALSSGIFRRPCNIILKLGSSRTGVCLHSAERVRYFEHFLRGRRFAAERRCAYVLCQISLEMIHGGVVVAQPLLFVGEKLLFITGWLRFYHDEDHIINSW